MNHALVAIVIIHWNKIELLQQFLPSVVKSTYPNLKIILADNASTDHSVNWVRQNYPQIEIIVLEQNHGYAGGYNRALKNIHADYFILLNNDVEVSPGWIEPVINVMQQDENMAAAQPKVLQYNRRNHFEYAGAAGGFLDHWGYVFCRGRVFECLEQDKGQYNNNTNIFWASGACLFVKAKAFFEVGGFDEDFFAHMEEVDLCWRLQLAGYQISYVGAGEVYHLGGSTLQKGSPEKTYLNFRNSLQMLLKNESTAKLLWLIPLRSTLDLLSSIFFLMNAKPDHSAAVHRAHAHFFFKFGKWWNKRKTVLRKGNSNQLKTIYGKSVVFEHFVNRKQNFSELRNIEKLTSG